MKIKILKIVVMSGLVVFGLFSCAHPNGKDINKSDININKDSLDLAKSIAPSKMKKSDDLLDYIDHNAGIDARYIQNVENLNEMQRAFKSETNAVQMKYDQSLYELKKTNLKIKTKVNGHVILDTKSWDDFKSSTNDEMNNLEKSIRILSE